MAGLKEQIKGKIEAVAEAIKGREQLPEVFRVLSESPGKADTWLEAASTALRTAKPDLARLILESHLEAAPADGEARLLLVSACLKLGTADGIAEGLAVARCVGGRGGGVHAACGMRHACRPHQPAVNLLGVD